MNPAVFKAEQGPLLAVWGTSAFDGLGWIDELVKENKAIYLGGHGGYPWQYTAQSAYILPLLINEPPNARGPWVDDVKDMNTAIGLGKSVKDPGLIASCPNDEWPVIEAWDES